MHQRYWRQRLTIDALCCQAAVIDASLDVGLTQRVIGENRPAFPQVDVLLPVIGELATAPLDRVHIEAGLCSEARGRDLARSSEQVRMEITRIAVVPWFVHCEIYRHLVTIRDLL